jgi:hypothetical protein
MKIDMDSYPIQFVQLNCDSNYSEKLFLQGELLGHFELQQSEEHRSRKSGLVES